MGDEGVEGSCGGVMGFGSSCGSCDGNDDDEVAELVGSMEQVDARAGLG